MIFKKEFEINLTVEKKRMKRNKNLHDSCGWYEYVNDAWRQQSRVGVGTKLLWVVQWLFQSLLVRPKRCAISKRKRIPYLHWIKKEYLKWDINYFWVFFLFFFFTSSLLWFDETSGTLNANDQTSSDLWIQSSRVS